MKQKLITNWYWIIIIGILFTEAAVFLVAGENSYIGIHDNLDIHITDYQLLKLNHAFFSNDTTIPILGGISRDFLLSEFSLYSFLYMLFPTFTAYMLGYFIKIGLALFSGILLGKDILGYDYEKYKWLIVLSSFIYGLLPLYPAFSFSFASIPLFIYLIRRILNEYGKRYYVYLFFYPLVSYFTFFGPFLIGYLFLYALYVSLKNKSVCKTLFTAILFLTFGYFIFEYRLFGLFLFSDETTIRDTMIMGSYNFMEILNEIKNVFINGIFHAEDLHRYFVLPVVVLYFILRNFLYIINGEWKQMISDLFNQIMVFIIFNCIIYAIYYWEDFRNFVELILPPLKGWQFNRTVFFNPFLWYLEIVIIAYRLMKDSYYKTSIALILTTMFFVIGSQSLYNDFFNTVYTHTYKIVKQKDTESLSYREFFSEDLFRKIKEDISYKGEYSVAYGFHPAVLSYNEISTLDACLSHYSQSYKEEFRKIIAPALEKSEVGRIYYDEWGGRAYIFSGTDESIWNPQKTMNITDYELSIDPTAFKNLNGVYIFSRIEISNADTLDLHLINKYTDEHSPYTIWVYSNKP